MNVLALHHFHLPLLPLTPTISPLKFRTSIIVQLVLPVCTSLGLTT